jgi:hypothetical protein
MPAFSSVPAVPEVLLGRSFGEAGLAAVRDVVASGPCLSRAQIAHAVCDRLQWRTPGGSLSLMSARVALLRLHRCGWIQLPPPRNSNANGRDLHPRPVDWPAELPLERPAGQIPGLALHPVLRPQQSTLYNALIERYHYLGFVPMAGAQMRYLIGWEGGWLGAIGFGAAAWQVRDRDRFIGWDPSRRKSRLHLLVGNSRFLIFPWVRCPHLASKVLGMSLRRLASDFRHRYGYSPVLVESFVEEERFAATSYRAANWKCVGRTQGRGKKGQWQDTRLPRKTVWIYPLHRRFHQILTAPLHHDDLSH